MWIILLSLFVIGLFFGSFYNCLANRIPKNESIISPGSHCENCNHRLTWYELIPVFSFLIQKGKCSKCKIKLPKEYIITELLTGIMFALSFYIFGFTYNTLLSIILCSLLIITVISDFKYMVIIDEVLLTSIILIIIVFLLQNGVNYLLQSLLRGLLIFGVLLITKLGGDKAFKQESLGWGDVKLSFVAGLVLGFKLGLVYLFVGAVIALPYGIIMRVLKRDVLIPFGPFLVTSLLIVYIFSEPINNLLTIIIGG